MSAVPNTGSNGQGRTPPLPIPDLHDDEDDTPIVAVDVLKEQYGRGELDLDRYLQRLVKARRTTEPPRRDAPAPAAPAPEPSPEPAPVIALEASTPPVQETAVPAPALRYDVTPESIASRLRASLALGVVAAIATWFVMREDHRLVTRVPAPERPAPMSAVPEPAFIAPDLADITVTPLVGLTASAPRAAATVGFSSPGRIVVPESSRYVTIPVRASGLRAPVTMSVTTRSGAARVNEDFVPPAPTITLTPARPEGRVLVSILGDDVRENVEDFSVRLGVEDGTATLGAREVTVVLTDADPAATSALRASP